MRRRRLILSEESSDGEMEAVTLNQASAAEEEVQWTWKREAIQTTKLSISVFNERVIIEQIAEELKLIGDEVYQEFLNSCFGFLMRFDTQGVTCKSALRCLFAHEVIKADAGPDELWFRIGGRFIRFSKYEYALVTGLSFRPTEFDPNAEHDPPESGLFLRRYGGRNMTMDALRSDFINGVFRGSPADGKKVAKLLIVYFLLFGKDARQAYIDEWAWTLIDDNDGWESFMWGKYTYQILLRYLQLVPIELPNSMTPTYRLHGFVWAFLIWAFEAIPGLGNACAVPTNDDVLPRCLRWRFKKNNRLDMGELYDHQFKVQTTLEPSAEEQRQSYWEHIHDDLRSGVCYVHRIVYATRSKKKKKTSASPVIRKRKRTGLLTTRASHRLAYQEKVPDLSSATSTQSSSSNSANSTDFKKCKKAHPPTTCADQEKAHPPTTCADQEKAHPPTTCADQEKAHPPTTCADQEKAQKGLYIHECGDQDEMTAAIQKKLPTLVRGTSSSTRTAPPMEENLSLDMYSEPQLPTLVRGTSSSTRTAPPMEENLSLDMYSEPQSSSVAVDQRGRNKLIFELNEKVKELKNKNLITEQLMGVYRRKYICVNTMMEKMGQEIKELRRQKLAAIKTVEDLRLKQLESDKAVELYKSRLENLMPKSAKIEADMLSVEVGDLSNRVIDLRKLATSEEGQNLDIPENKGEKDKSDNGPNGSTPDGAENVVAMSRGVHSISNSSGRRNSGLSGKGNRNSVQPQTREECDAHNTVKTYRGSQPRNNPPEVESLDTVRHNEHREPRASAECEGNITTGLVGLTRLSDEAFTDCSNESRLDSKMDDLIVSLWSKNLSRKWTYEADMLRAFQQDEELCMNAVCALYRQHVVARKSKGRSTNGGFSSIDSISGCALAEYLIDGDGELRLRKSVSEVKKERPDAISQCRKLATIYVEELFQIYSAADDPFFGQQ